MTVFYFTGTGNSLFAARKIAASLDAGLVSIPQAISEKQTYTDDCIGFVYPQYANGLPKMVRKFILSNTFSSKYIFAVNLYAFMHANSLGEIAGIIPINYGAYLKTPNNFIFAFSPPSDPSAVLKRAEHSLDKVIRDISKRKNKTIKPRVGEGGATKYFGKSSFKATQSCVKCGTCASVCPAKNIELKGSVTFGSRCENCFACVNLCPKHAIYSNNAMLKRRQYRNPVVTAREIADSNSAS